jgi:hypothetical protein
MPEATFDNSTITIPPHLVPRVRRRLLSSEIGQAMTDLGNAEDALRRRLNALVGNDATEAIMEPLDAGASRTWDAIDVAISRKSSAKIA